LDFIFAAIDLARLTRTVPILQNRGHDNLAATEPPPGSPATELCEKKFSSRGFSRLDLN
jgi:hypothetical protein